ncbi:LysR family transcriptional regulator [Paraburkholderia pallida]|uniref:LysR family transcriptional regulator n=1 Tax=Paraburkholderia pallida TaxID=2547399 RepID=A0A4P7D0P7_9BURK|nr:LysR substrate-binding domain-containing protein [Paraburkholderia pallida]QBR02231.1 LysR family transcriptional regulator [Paraburkholderia pallida]
MDIKQLRYFVRIAELGSVGKASDVLSIAQPTLSRQVRALEVELKTSLFSRNGRGVILTPAGRRFLEHARGVLHAADSALIALKDGTAVYEGRVVAGLTPSVGRTLIPTFVERFVERFPKASLSLVEGYSLPLHEQMLLGQLDFAIVLNPATSPSLVIEPIATQGLYLIGLHPIGPSAEEVALSELARIPLIMPHASHAIKPLLQFEAARLGIMLNMELEIDAVRSIIELVERGIGYTVMPINSIRASNHPTLHWQRIVAPEIEVTLSMITPVKRPHTALPVEAARLAMETLVSLLNR